MTGNLIVVSNRLPSLNASGGLVVALEPALRERGGIWIGAHDDTAEDPPAGTTRLPADGYEKRAFHLTQADHDNYYLGYANSVLWPLCHRRGDLVAIDRTYAKAYASVNRDVARHVHDAATEASVIWVQDYHFLPLAMQLRDIGVSSRIGLFLHIPFPSLGGLQALPEREDFYEWIAAYDLVGLQTRGDVARCLEVFRNHPEAEVFLDGRIKFRSRVFSVRSFPIGIDVEAFAGAAGHSTGDRERLALGAAERLIIGVDRLDYSKGLPNRLLAFGRYLEDRQNDDPRTTMLQIAPPTREGVSAYQQIREELELIAGRVNGNYAQLDWTPIRYIHRSLPRDELASLYRLAKVGLVTPLIDGMNLVAKEYVAAQDAEDPGVLILSHSAGAAEDMQAALLVNPYDVDEMADAIGTALRMPLAERRERNASLMEVVHKTNVSAWSRTFLDCLSRTEGSLRQAGTGQRVEVEGMDAG